MASAVSSTSTSGASVAVVTGASRGLGAAIAERLATDGWRVACIATNRTNAEPIAERIDGLALGARVEVRQELDDALDEIEAQLGPIALIVNNAGITHVQPFLDMPLDDFRRVVDVNLIGVFNGAQAAAQRMVASGTPGAIISIGSVAGRLGFPMRAGYCATKAAVHQMTKVMAIDLASHNIRVNCIAPGYIRTDMVQDLIDAGTLAERSLQSRIPAGDLGTPADIAAAAAWLASPEARYVTGETITIDGGWAAYGHI